MDTLCSKAMSEFGIAAEGLNASLGVLHSRRPGRDALVLDLMEPLRAVVDQGVFRLVGKHGLHPGDILLGTNGAVTLHPQLARTVVQVVSLALKTEPGSVMSAGLFDPVGFVQSRWECRASSQAEV